MMKLNSKEQIDNFYDKQLNINNLYSCWYKVKKTCKNRKKVLNYDMNLNSNIEYLYYRLKNNIYEPNKYKIFVITRPKVRLVMSQSINDKIVNHFIVNYIFNPLLENKLIDSNVATRKNKGTSKADKLLVNYINTIRQKYNNKDIYALRLDIKKYFYNIDHNILLNMLSKDLYNSKVLNLIKIILNQTNKDYVNEVIKNCNIKYNNEIPIYKENIGLSIGAVTSQFLAIYYLNKLDHYIKEELKCKYYIRYMDDLIILNTDKQILKDIWNNIDKKVLEYNITLNNKCNITNLKYGVNFLGYKYIIKNNKFIVDEIKSKTYKINRKLNKLEKSKNIIKYKRSLASYNGYFKRIGRKIIMNNENNYTDLKKQYPTTIILCKDKRNFFNTYDDDALVLWKIMDYKLREDNIVSFGQGALNKVESFLMKEDISYMIYNQDNSYVPGSKKAYELYLEIAKRKIDVENKMKELKEKLEVIIDNDLYEKYKENLDEFIKNNINK